MNNCVLIIVKMQYKWKCVQNIFSFEFIRNKHIENIIAWLKFCISFKSYFHIEICKDISNALQKWWLIKAILSQLRLIMDIILTRSKKKKNQNFFLAYKFFYFKRSINLKMHKLNISKKLYLLSVT